MPASGLGKIPAFFFYCKISKKNLIVNMPEGQKMLCSTFF